jgi:hypothetical protein
MQKSKISVRWVERSDGQTDNDLSCTTSFIIFGYIRTNIEFLRIISPYTYVPAILTIYYSVTSINDQLL